LVDISKTALLLNRISDKTTFDNRPDIYLPYCTEHPATYYRTPLNGTVHKLR